MSHRRPPQGVSLRDLDQIQGGTEPAWASNNMDFKQANRMVGPPPNVTGFPMNGLHDNSPPTKATGKKLKKKKVQSVTAAGNMMRAQLPPVDFAGRLTAEQQKLDALQRIATANSQKYDMLKMQSESVSSDVSGSEAQFLARQMHSRDDAMVTTPMIPSPSRLGKPSVELQDRGQQVSNTLIVGRLQEKVLELETQIGALQSTVRNKEAELEKKDKRLRGLQQEMEKIKVEAVNEARRLQNEHETELIKLREMHAKEKVTLLSSGGNNNNSSGAHRQQATAPGESSSSSSASASDQTKKLLQQNETLRHDLRKAQDAFAEERRFLQTEAEHQRAQQERQWKSAIAECKAQIAALEDKLTAGQDDLTQARQETFQWQRRYQQLEQSKEQAIATQAQLRADLKAMQQSVQATYRLETQPSFSSSTTTVGGTNTTAITGGGDPETMMRLHDAQHEAKVKQLVHKVDFLKQQLETEKRALEESRHAYQDLQGHLASLRDEQQRKMHELQRQHEQRLVEAEANVALNYETRMQELTVLQRQVVSYQAQTQSQAHETLAARERERVAQEHVQRLTLQLQVAQTEHEQLQTQLQALEAQRDAELKQHATKFNQEAVLRRLDNERHYLKNQLTTEITLKSEVQRMLTECQRQLQETQAQWQADVRTLQEAQQQQTETTKAELEQQQMLLTTTNSSLQHLQAQHAQLKEAFVKQRDQLRMEQHVVENLQSEQRRVQEELRLAQEEIQRLNTRAIQTQAEQSEATQQLQDLLHSVEQQAQQEAKRLREELAKQFADNAALQITVLKQRESVAHETTRIGAQVHVMSLYQVLVRWQRNRVARAFKSWLLNTTLHSVALQFKQKMESILQQVKSDMQALQQQVLAQQRRAWEDEQSRALQSQAQALEASHALALQSLTETHQQALRDAQADFNQQLQQLEQDHAFDLQQAQQQLHNSHAEHVQVLAHQRESLTQKHQAHIESLRVEWQQQQDEKLQEAQALWQATQAQEQERTLQSFQQTKAQLQAQFEIDLDQQARRLQQEFRTQQTQHDQVQQLQWQQQLKETQIQHEQAVLQLQKAHAQALETARHEALKHETAALSEQRSSMQVAQEERLRILRQEWVEEHDAAVEKITQSLTDAFALKEAALEAQGATALQTAREELRRQLDHEKHALEVANAAYRETLREELLLEARTEMETERRRFEETLALNALQTQEKISLALQEQELAFVTMKETFVEESQRTLQAEMQAYMQKTEVDVAARLQDTLVREFAAKEAALQEQLRLAQAHHEQMKNDIVQRNHFFATERTNLLQQLQQADARIESIEATKRVEIAQCQRDAEHSLELLRIQQTEEIQQLQRSYAHKESILRESLQEEHAEEMEQEVQRAQRDLQADFDRQLQALQQESETLITQLEKALHELKAEKTTLTQRVEAVQSRLEDTEDTLFDTKRQWQASQKAASIQQWQMVSQFLQVKAQFAVSLTEQDAAHQIHAQKLRDEAQYAYEDLAYQCYRLGLYIWSMEEKRVALAESIQSFKPQELRRLKKLIHALEQDIDTLSMDREQLETLRAEYEEEIVHMTQQVQEQEVQIKQLQAESAMTVNGRINVAFARKKRRLDQEIERLLESIEVKRGHIQEVDEKLLHKTKQREEKEAAMIDVERQLVGILIEQQRCVAQEVQSMGGYADKTQYLFSVLRLFPWPPKPTIAPASSSSSSSMMAEDEEDDDEGGDGKKNRQKQMQDHYPEPTFDDLRRLIAETKLQQQLQQQALANEQAEKQRASSYSSSPPQKRK